MIFHEIDQFLSQRPNLQLLDVQSFKNEIYYIFKDTQTKKRVIYKFKSKDNYYYFYNYKNIKGSFININDLKLIKGDYYEILDKYSSHTTCEKDFSLSMRHAADFYLNYPDKKVNDLKIMFVDIELDLTDPSVRNVMQDQHNGFAPICMISYQYNNDDNIYTLTIDNGKFKNKNYDNVKFFKNEIEMLIEFVRILHHDIPDILTAWNSIFDFGYIYRRLRTLKYNVDSLSLLHKTYFNPEYYKITYYGFVILDMLTLYKSFTLSERASYKLDYIAQLELGIGKEEYEGDIFSLFTRDPDKMLIYNRQDVNLIRKLNDKLKHIELQNQLRNMCGLDWASSLSTLGLIDGILIQYIRQKYNAALITNAYDKVKRVYLGAYNKKPETRIFEWCIDLDYASLYPSLIRSYNMGPDTVIGKINMNDAYDIIFEKQYNKNEYEFRVLKDGDDYNTTISKEKLQEILKNSYMTITGAIFKKDVDESTTSIYKTILNDMGNLRKKYKQLYIDQKKNNDPNWIVNFIIQWAVKVFSNSIYGGLGNENFRYYNDVIAEAITISGRELIRYTGIGVEEYLNGNKDIKYIIEKTKPYIRKMDGDTYTRKVFYTDTDSIFIELNDYIQDRKNPVKDILERLAPELENLVNNDLISHYIKLHNLNPNEKILKVKQEWISRRVLMFAKKNYCMWCINENGKDIDEIHIVGLLRSEIPEYTQQKIKDVINLILRADEHGVDLNELIQIKEQVARNILDKIKENDMSIFKIAAFQKDIKDYKSIPSSLRGMLLWNAIMDKYKFNTGDKGYYVPIIGIDVNKLNKQQLKKYYDYQMRNKFKINAIVIPREVKKIHEAFIIDKKRLLETAWFSVFDRVTKPLMTISYSYDTW